MTFKVDDKITIGVNGYDWDLRDPATFEGATGTVVKVYLDVEPNVFDIVLDDQDLHKELSGGEDIHSWPFYENELIHAAAETA